MTTTRRSFGNRVFDASVLVAFTDTSQRLFPNDAIELLIKLNPSDLRLQIGHRAVDV